MRLSPKRRGSALIYVSVITVAITTVVIGTVQMNLVASEKAERRIDDARAEETFNAQVALVKSISKSNDIVLPLTFNCTMNGHTLACTVTDNDAVLTRSYRIASAGSGLRSRTFSRVVGGRQTSHPFYYALWTGTSLDVSATGLTTTNGGHVCVGGNATLGASTSIAGDILARNSLTLGAATITKNTAANYPTAAYHAINRTALQADATSTITLPSLTSISFLSLLVNGHYAVHYYSSATALSGNISGKGTAVFEKNLTITGNVQYLSGTARAIFIVDGDLTINSGVTRVDGMWYVRGKIIANGTSTAISNTRGALACLDSLVTTRPFNIAMDPALFNGRSEAQKHCVPGFWPTPAAGLMR